ncbi:MAG: thiol:disulfide interchange protein DsbA/DsbL [Thiohalocapsa sp. PB-PSB1]|nr:MAG: thiol:disulfide interchange protein DsbA/DsbL [Thiohalocapsa sp. PB-PSB1]
MAAKPALIAALGILAIALAIALTGAVSAPARAEAAQEIDEGIDYLVIENPMRAEQGDDVEVLELFWYGCPHCYHLEPHIERWLAGKPEGVSFRRLPAASSPRWVSHAKAYYAAQILGELDKLHEPLFKALHDQRRKIFSDEQIIAFAAEQGIDEDAFRKAYNSFPVDMQVRKSAELVRNYHIDGVPAIVVNGKYITSATQTGSTENMFKVVSYLVAEEIGAKAAAGAEASEAPAD